MLKVTLPLLTSHQMYVYFTHVIRNIETMASVAWFDSDSGVKSVDFIFLEKRQCNADFMYQIVL